MSIALGRAVTWVLAAAVAAVTAQAAKTAGVPGLAESLALAGSVMASPAAALGAVDRIVQDSCRSGLRLAV